MSADSSSEKPTFEIVHIYAKKTVEHFIRKYARHLSSDQQEEIAQDAFLRTWEAYQKLDAAKGWKSFIQLHCRGACLDYLKLGNGNIEDGYVSEDSFDGLKTRVEIYSEGDDGQILDVDQVAGIFGVSSDPFESDEQINPNWNLLSRLIGHDDDLHIICKVLLGFTQEQISEQLGKAGVKASRERVSQRIYEFIERLDSPMHLNDRFINQCIFALGLSKQYHMRAHDNGLGWDSKSFDLNDPESFHKVKSYYTPTFWDSDDQEMVI